jgi:hypothetical protein
MECNDPFVIALKSKGYSLVAYPKTSIRPLHVYEHTIKNAFKRIWIQSEAKPMSGFIKSLFSDKINGAIGLSDGQGIDIDLRKTNGLSSTIAAKILGSYFQDSAPSFDLAFENSSSVIFHLEEILTTDADEISLRNWLNDNQKELREIYREEIKKGNFFVATSLLRAKKMRMQFERKSTAELGVDMSKIKNLPVEAKLESKIEGSNYDKLVFETRDEGIVFGVKLVRLFFSDNDILTIDRKQDFSRVLGENMELNLFLQ